MGVVEGCCATECTTNVEPMSTRGKNSLTVVGSSRRAAGVDVAICSLWWRVLFIWPLSAQQRLADTVLAPWT